MVETSEGRPGRRTDIQALRALAVTAVVIDHYAPDWLPGGFIGVDMFFVISGYLIVGQLLGAVRRGERISLARFYARRARRILPAAFLAATVTFLAYALFLNPLQIDLYGRQFIGAVAFVSNFVVRAQPGGYFAPIDPTPFLHFWSLAVEEQFYLVAPVMLILGAAMVRRPRVLVGLIGAGTLVSFTGAAWLGQHSSNWAFYMLPGRAWEFGVGALVSVVPSMVRGAYVLRWAGLIVAVVPMFLVNGTSGVPGVAALPVVLGTAALLAAGTVVTPSLRVPMIAPIRYLGDISYSLYLWHWPPICFVLIEADGDRPGVVPSLLALAAGLLLAVASYHLVERPIHLNARLLARPLTTVGGALGLAGLLVATGLVVPPPTPLASPRPAEALAGSTVLAGPVTGPGYVPSNATPDLRHILVHNRLYPGCHDAVGDSRLNPCEFGEASSDRTVVMAGDSHSAHWLDAFDTASADLGYRLVALTKSSCPPEALPPEAFKDPSCAVWQRNLVRYLITERPSVIVLSGTTSAYRGESQSATAYALAVEKAWRATLRALPDGVPVVVLGDVPTPPADPSRCLARHLDDSRSCTFVPSSTQLYLENAERRAVESAGATWVDTIPWFCSATSCAVQAGNVLVWRDVGGHLTVPMSRLLAPRVAGALRPLLDRSAS